MRRRARSNTMELSASERLVNFVSTHYQSLAIGIVSVCMLLLLYPDESTPSALLKALLLVSPVTSIDVGASIAIGWNTNVDVIVNSMEFMAYVATLDDSRPKDLMSEASPPQAIDTPSSVPSTLPIESLDSFVSLFESHFSSAIAGERHVSNPTLFDSLVTVATLKMADSVMRCGGNAALMANQLSREGFHVSLFGPVGPLLRPLLEPNVTVSLSPDESHPVATDELHLILEYPKGATWHNHVAHRANRFIVTRDLQNAQLTGVEALQLSFATTSPPSLVILSGLHLLVSVLEADVMTARLAAVQVALASVPSETPIHVEMASIVNVTFLATLASQIFPAVDSLGLNEVELTTLYTVVAGNQADASVLTGLSASMPEVSAVSSALAFLLDTFGPSTSSLSSSSTTLLRGLTRIHFHSLAYHMSVTRVVPATFKSKTSTTTLSTSTTSSLTPRRWQNARAALAHGSVVATLRACNASSVSALNAAAATSTKTLAVLAPLSFPIDTEAGRHLKTVSVVTPVVEWTMKTSLSSALLQVHYTPVVVCEKPVQTVGLGDAISSSALGYTLVLPSFRDE